MLTINDTYYSAADFAKLEQTFADLQLQQQATRALAVCLEDTATWLALVFYMQRQQCSVMPIHPSTPLETAKTIAANAGCYRLYYQDLAHAIDIPTSASQGQANAAPGLIQMSSGTTGAPKFIQRSWHDIDIEIQSYVSTLRKAEQMNAVVACPVSHSYGLICGVMAALARKQQPTVITTINPKYLVKKLLNTERPLLYSSPTMLQGVIRFWPKHSRLHAVMTSGTMMSQATLDQLSQHIEHLFQQYGCSEAGCVSINQNMCDIQNMGTPLPHLSVSCSDDPRSPSEILVHIKHRENSVIHTQDLGYLAVSEGGEKYLNFVARQDDTIIVAGLNVYPQQVEDIILKHPLIDDALVFKIDDPYAGQRVALIFVAQQPLDTAELRQWCSQNLADFQRPYHLRQVENIQRMANGKVNRKNFAQHFLQQHSLAHANQVEPNNPPKNSIA